MNDRETKWSEALRAERRGDAAAYEAFLRDFGSVMRRIITARLRLIDRGANEAEDVLQEILIAVHRRRREWNAARPLLPWLNAIARYKMIDAMRRLQRQARGRVDLSEVEWARLFSAENTSPEPVSKDVNRLVSTLPPSQQAAVRAVAMEGASHREAAQRLGISEGAVRVALHRSFKKLAAAAKQRTWG